ncbi:MAG: aldehyde dehydrogenase family protein [Alphaproteobacteria bacterium]
MTDIAATFAGLKANTPALKQTTGKARADRILALLDATLSRKEELYAASNKERGTCDMDVAAELMMLSMEAKFIAKNVAKWVKPHKVKGSLASMGKKSYLYYEPKGVVLNLSTWNAPAVIGLYPMLPAIAAGNACYLKPSELAPYSAEVLEKIVSDVFPADEFAVAQGGPETAQALLAQPFDHIYYTGGHNVGRIVMEAAAKNFASITLEMGGKSPVIIDPSVNVDNAAKKIIWGRMANAGQMCVAADYMLVPTQVQDKMVAALIAQAHALYNADGQGFDKAPEFARIINDAHFARIKGLLDDAISKGAKVELGGESDAATRYIAPTVLTNVTEDMTIMHEEVFGPILPIMTYDKREDAVEMVERRTKPLALYIYGTDEAAMEWFINHTSAGSTVLNHNCVQSGTNPNLPFGGVGHSGMGRVGGFRGFVEMSNNRAVMKQPLDRIRDMAVNFPPYSDRYKSMISKGLES